jgi:FMN phosphatase YigB (HAD superfamily)
MLKSLLLDLDETILPYSCSFEEVMGSLVKSMTGYFSHLVPPDLFVQAFMAGVDAIDSNRDEGPSNFEVFARTFCASVEMSPDEMEKLGIDYYENAFMEMQHLTRPTPYARTLMTWAFESDFEVVIATGWQAPLIAAEQRLRWAGVPASEFDYRFIADWHNMHASKPHPEFYQEILEHVGRQPDECLFVGDDWEVEIMPATGIGIPSYWIVDEGTTPPEALELLMGVGQLPDLLAWLNTTIKG